MLTLKPGILKPIAPIAFGTAVYAFGLHYFVIPNELMEGGVTGVALLLNYALGLPPSMTTLLINAPLFYLGLKSLGRQPMLYSIVGTLLLSLFLWMMETLIRRQWLVPMLADGDYFLITAYAGFTLGSGLGIVFRFGGTTGGSDIVARVMQKRHGWSMGRFILLSDALVIGSSLLFIPKEKVLYTFVAVFITSKMIDIIQEGAYAAKAFTIVTDRADEVASAIATGMERGVTLFPAKGGYSGLTKTVVYCVVYRSETKRLKDLVRSVDARAFIIITEVHDVVGEGFKPE